MHLLHARSKRISHFFHDNTPPYAILSHRWGSEEISFKDVHKLLESPTKYSQLALKEGFKKIEGCCEQALRDGLEWIWVDTCCIDKKNSTEMSEAINSMFHWYKESQVCYAYLADVSAGESQENSDSAFRNSVWFTRGWTLQELLAPLDLLFFSKSWTFIGKRTDLCDVIKDVTCIPNEFLSGRPLCEASIAQRMSWAAKRVTTRKEDIAYCLLGIFDVNMPLLYGEGEKAFKRLQEEIIKQSDDQSIFAWGLWRPMSPAAPTNEIGILAKSPLNFAGCENIICCRAWKPRRTASFEMTKDGLRIELPLVKEPLSHQLCRVPRQDIILGLLNCRLSNDLSNLIAVPLGQGTNAITLAGENLTVDRYQTYATTLCSETFLKRASFQTIYIGTASSSTSNRDFDDLRVLTSHTIVTEKGRIRSYSVLMKPPLYMSCQVLSADASLEVFHRGDNIIIRERSKLNEIHGVDTPGTAYLHYQNRERKSEDLSFIVRVEFLHETLGAILLLKKLSRLNPHHSLPLERSIRCQIASTPGMEKSNLYNAGYLRNLVWAQYIIAAGCKVVVKSKKKRVMGEEAFVARLKSTPVEQPSLERLIGVLIKPLLNQLFSEVTIPKSQKTEVKYMVSFGFGIYILALGINQGSFSEKQLMSEIFRATGAAYFAQFQSYLVRDDFITGQAHFISLIFYCTLCLGLFTRFV